MTPPHLSIADALMRLAEGHIVPRSKYAALQRHGYIRVRGHGHKAKPVVTESGRELLTANAKAGG